MFPIFPGESRSDIAKVLPEHRDQGHDPIDAWHPAGIEKVGKRVYPLWIKTASDLASLVHWEIEPAAPVTQLLRRFLFGKLFLESFARFVAEEVEYFATP